MAKKKPILRPQADYVLLEVLPSEGRTPSGLYIPDNAARRPNRAKVIAVGPGRFVGARRVEPLLKAGDEVIFDPYQIKLVLADNALANAHGTPFANIGDQCLLHEEDIYAVVTP
jgi:chaperonin GroES